MQGTYKNLANLQKQNSRNFPQPMKSAAKSGKMIKFIDKIKHDKNDGKTHTQKINKIEMTPRNTKLIKNDTVTEIQVSNLDTSAEIRGDSSGWRHLPEIPSTSEDSDSGETDKTEWLDNSFLSEHTYSIKSGIWETKIIRFHGHTSKLWPHNSSIWY